MGGQMVVTYGSSTRSARRLLWRRIHDAALLAATRTAPSEDEWSARARKAAEGGDPHAAAYAAGQACMLGFETGELRHIRALACLALGRYMEALTEVGRAVQLQPTTAEHHVVLGAVFEALGNRAESFEAYRSATLLAATHQVRAAARIGLGSLLLHNGEVEPAVELLKDPAGDALAVALVDLAEGVPAVQHPERYLITSRDEIDVMRGHLGRAQRAASMPEVRTLIGGVRAHVDRCARREFRTFWTPRWRTHRRVVTSAPQSAILSLRQ